MYLARISVELGVYLARISVELGVCRDVELGTGLGSSARRREAMPTRGADVADEALAGRRLPHCKAVGRQPGWQRGGRQRTLGQYG